MTELSKIIPESVAVDHIIKGELVTGTAANYGAFCTPELDIDALVWQRTEAGPAFHTPIDEVMDVLVATGERSRLRSEPFRLGR